MYNTKNSQSYPHLVKFIRLNCSTSWRYKICMLQTALSNKQNNHCAILRVQPTRCDFFQFIYFRKTLYMFQSGFPSIIRSSKLHIQRQVRPTLLPAASLNGISIPSRLAADSSNGLTNAWRYMCSFELLMMDGKPDWNM